MSIVEYSENRYRQKKYYQNNLQQQHLQIATVVFYILSQKKKKKKARWRVWHLQPPRGSVLMISILHLGPAENEGSYRILESGRAGEWHRPSGEVPAPQPPGGLPPDIGQCESLSLCFLTTSAPAQQGVCIPLGFTTSRAGPQAYTFTFIVFLYPSLLPSFIPITRPALRLGCGPCMAC